jgi:hypothetical protein
MRLIDADAFKKWLLDRAEEPLNDIVLVFLAFIESRETAYDVDKVIDELHELAEYINGRYMISVENAIEIVKRGGVDG